MTKNEVYSKWQKLCEEHEAARNNYFRAFAVVNQKFASIAQGTSSINPTDEELSEFESTWETLGRH